MDKDEIDPVISTLAYDGQPPPQTVETTRLEDEVSPVEPVTAPSTSGADLFRKGVRGE